MRFLQAEPRKHEYIIGCMIRTTLAWTLLAGALVLPAQTGAPEFLLPKDVVPIRHAVEMTIDPSRDSYSGLARIQVRILRPQQTIWLNGKDLVVDEASIQAGGTVAKADPILAGGEFIGLRLDQPVAPGRAVLSIRYRAPLSDTANAGPYRRQMDGDWYMFTIFTPIDARRAFPCFDEPEYKTPWQMSIRVKSTDKAFANGPAASVTEESGGGKLYRFAETEPLPAEIVAFAVGPFDEYDGGTAGAKNTPVRVITPKGRGSEGRQAALATHEILPRLEGYMGIPYPYAKLYHIALPAGAFGATENPGLITYQSRSLLVEPGAEAPERLFGIRRLQTHEVAHQWFGNMVTQSTWEDVYLSEGFATWITAKLMDQEQPPARRRLSAVTARERIMGVDAGPETHPVRWRMKSRDDLYAKGRGVYNQIAYQKGAAILLMLDGWLGEDRVQKGVRRYLKTHAYGRASTGDVVAALRTSTGTDTRPVLDSFLDKTGIPTVRFELQCEAGKRPRLLLEQTNRVQTWSIPVCWSGAGLKQNCAMLDGPQREVTLKDSKACPAWVFPNAGGTGYYRTEWSAAQLATVTAQALGTMSAPERLTLAYDIRTQQAAGRLEPAVAQAVLDKLAADPVPEIVQAAKGMPAPGR
jgi:alanyl aminopeptidase